MIPEKGGATVFVTCFADGMAKAIAVKSMADKYVA
jgi:hypothetical protein